MVKTRLYIAAVASVMVLAGCGGDAPPAPTNAMGRLQTPTTAPSVPSLATTSDINATREFAPPVNSADAIAQRAASFAKEISLPPTSPGMRVVGAPPKLHADDAEKPQKAGDFSDPRDFPDPDSMHLTASLAVADPAMIQRHELIQASPIAVPRERRAPAAVAAANPMADDLSAALSRRAHDYPMELSAQTDDELLRLLKDEQVPDPSAMSQLQPEDREVLGALIDGLTNFRNGLRQNNNMLLSQKVSPLIDMSERLKAQAELTIPTVTFVTTLNGFGNYTPLKPAQFVAGKRQLTHLYFEVENFASQLNAGQLYETRLRVTRVLYTEGSGMPVLNDPSVNVTDVSYRRRHDYFVRSDMVLPANLSIGRYLLKVTVEDLQARRIAENTIPVEIVASVGQ